MPSALAPRAARLAARSMRRSPSARQRSPRRPLLAAATVACAAAGAGGGAPGNAFLVGETAPAELRFGLLPVAGDGRCLFRSLVAARALASGAARPDAKTETAAADELRAAALTELKARREELEWALERPWDEYLRNMAQTAAWGGEIELLCLSHALREQIAVYIPIEKYGEPWPDQQRGVVALPQGEVAVAQIALYGEDEYPPPDVSECDAAALTSLLFDGVGHYQGLAPLAAQAKL